MNPRKIAVSALLAIGAVGLAPATAAFAGQSTSASIALSSVSNGAKGLPSLGSSVWYATSYGSGTKNPVIDTECYQAGTLVWSEIDTVSNASLYGVKLGGDSSPWMASGGSASCTAALQSRVFKAGGETVVTMAQTAFSAAS